MFLLTENCTSRAIFLRETACHRGWSPLSRPLPSLPPKLPTLAPNPQPRVQPNLLLRWQPSLQLRWQPNLQPSLQRESPFLWPLWSTCSSSKSNTRPEKVAHRACFSVELKTHPNRQFLAHFVVHTPLCLRFLCRVARPLHSNRGCEGTVARPLAIQGGTCPQDCILHVVPCLTLRNRRPLPWPCVFYHHGRGNKWVLATVLAPSQRPVITYTYNRG